MIKARSSNDYLHTSVILDKISEYDIFRYYCPNFKNLGEKFCSELRKDTTPSVSIVLWNNRLLYKDFGYPDHTFNCFSYVMYKYTIDFVECLKMISRDFNLGLDVSTGTSKARTYNYDYTTIPKKKSIIKIRKRDWEYKDIKYWENYGITKELLVSFAVYPITHFWINDARFRSDSLSYAYRFDTGYKIYQPYSTDSKWFSNVSKKTVQGYNQLPESGDTLFITSSLKDVMCLTAMGFHAIALQSEMLFPEKELIDELKSRFLTILVLYDNDYGKDVNPGQLMGNRISSGYGIRNVCIPERYDSKDVSDLVSNHGLGYGKQFIRDTLNEQS